MSTRNKGRHLFSISVVFSTGIDRCSLKREGWPSDRVPCTKEWRGDRGTRGLNENTKVVERSRKFRALNIVATVASRPRFAVNFVFSPRFAFLLGSWREWRARGWKKVSCRDYSGVLTECYFEGLIKFPTRRRGGTAVTKRMGKGRENGVVGPFTMKNLTSLAFHRAKIIKWENLWKKVANLRE